MLAPSQRTSNLKPKVLIATTPRAVTDPRAVRLSRMFPPQTSCSIIALHQTPHNPPFLSPLPFLSRGPGAILRAALASSNSPDNIA